jgi:hypothetical protein
MAKKKRGVKSQAIRDYLTANIEAGVSDVVGALKQMGVSVSKQMVSTIRMRMKGAPKKRGPKKKRKGAKKNGAMVSLGILMQAKRLADQLGGVEKAKEAMDALAKLQ